jgi:hypothetical protein
MSKACLFANLGVDPGDGKGRDDINWFALARACVPGELFRRPVSKPTK